MASVNLPNRKPYRLPHPPDHFHRTQRNIPPFISVIQSILFYHILSLFLSSSLAVLSCFRLFSCFHTQYITTIIIAFGNPIILMSHDLIVKALSISCVNEVDIKFMEIFSEKKLSVNNSFIAL